jgi:hypothetical protein
MDAVNTVPAAAPHWRADLRLLYRPAAIFAVALLAAVALAGISGWYRADQDRALADATEAHDRVAGRLANAERELHDIQTFQPRYVALRDAGWVGTENRLGWIEAIQASRNTRRLPAVAYDIEPQQSIALPAPLKTGDIGLRGSRMALHLGLLHEGDLFSFFSDLRQAGLYTVQDCAVKRTAAAPDAPPDAPRLQADCTLVWLTIAVPPGATP